MTEKEKLEFWDKFWEKTLKSYRLCNFAWTLFRERFVTKKERDRIMDMKID